MDRTAMGGHGALIAFFSISVWAAESPSTLPQTAAFSFNLQAIPGQGNDRLCRAFRDYLNSKATPVLFESDGRLLGLPEHAGGPENTVKRIG